MKAAVTLAFVLGLAGCATAGGGPAPPPPGAPNARARSNADAPPIPTDSAALERLTVPAADLPPGVSMTAGDPVCASVQPITFYGQPATFGVLPRPRARRAELIRTGTRVAGSVLMFEYGPDEIPRVRSFLDPLLWGDPPIPSAEHPEEVVVLGETLLILCLDPRDDAVEWYRDRLRTRYHARLTRHCPELEALQQDVAQQHAETAEAIVEVVSRHRTGLLACSTGALFVAELERGRRAWPAAEAAFRRALELDAQGDALTIPGSLWGAHDGLALAIAMQGRGTESVGAFQSALAAAQADGDPKEIGPAQYNLACSQAEAGDVAAAVAALKAAIDIDPANKAQARADDSFAKIRDTPAMRQLLK